MLILLGNLSRMQNGFLQAREEAKANRAQMFQHRGISLDSNLWPDYDVDLSLQTLLKSGRLKPGGIGRVAIVGSGLDFVNKQQGVDYYPPQTTAVIRGVRLFVASRLGEAGQSRAVHI